MTIETRKVQAETPLHQSLFATVQPFNSADPYLLRCVSALRISIGIVYIWFGSLKLAAGASPAEALALRAITKMTFSILSEPQAVVGLGVWECLIGISLLTNRLTRFALLALYAHMFGTLVTLLLFPADMFRHLPYAPTLEGQYIIKNIILLSGAAVVRASLATNRRVQQ